ncbi:hypothetical protein FQN54_007670 [Arachnomyces sp. PD_36]|nr:hypothetical protein FQN54_007670 [Arachnomyces sp. PD_36]
MAWALPTDIPKRMRIAPSRTTSQQSSSLPSTPYQQPRNFSFRSRSPSPKNNTSPRSTHSESNHPLPSLRKPSGGCKYETGMAHFRRRMPYSLGGELLPEEKEPLKKCLDPEEDKKLEGDMREVYNRLLPSAESEERRTKLVQKLETLLNTQWPGNDIRVHVFGSSGNKLCSSDSDVDICITTPLKELEQVCILAEVLAKHGMERVVCVSHAKVPIVKIWDPELQLACDMNVNNTLALENTRMIKTYVDIDERVRPLAMIVKYWTKRRILNDAALGGTLSSYTWICLIINFLQTRSPPILPSLQQRPHGKQETVDGSPSKFDDDIDSLAGFGKENKQSLGELFFEFFRYYGHDLDYERNVISVREGQLISKEGKGWHLLQNNRLCVEEPFNTSRNLGNTADDTSFRGVHIELRRAFKAVSEANFEQCCEQYEYPPEEERVWERPAPQRRPIIASTPSNSSRGGRGGGRGGRNSSHYNRGSNGGRRSSSATNRPNNFRHGNGQMSASELSLQAQHAQYLLHDHLYQQIQILQAQEQELRIQLQHQAMITGRPAPTLIRQPNLQFPLSQQQESAADEGSRSRAGTVNHPPLSGPGRQQVAYNNSYAPMTASSLQGANTNPPSPSTPAAPDVRRHHRHASTANGSPRGSLRAQSQPARPLPSPISQSFSPYYVVGDIPSAPKSRHVSGSPKQPSREVERNFIPYAVPIMSRPSYMDDGRAEYVGYYYATGSPRLQAYHQNSLGSPVAAHTGLAMQNGASPFARSAPDYRSPAVSPPRSSPDQTFATTSKMPPPQHKGSSRPATNRQDYGPLIVDGSVSSSDQRRSSNDGSDHYMDASQCTSPSDEVCDTPASMSDAMSQDLQDHSSYESDFHAYYARQQQELQQQAQANGRDALGISNGVTNGHHTRPGNLAGRLQALQIAHSDPAYDSSNKSGRGKYNKYGNHTHAESDVDVSDVPFSPSSDKFSHSNTAPVLSPVKEARTPSPTAKRRSNGLSFERMNGNSVKAKPRTRQEVFSPRDYAMALKERQVEALPQKPNGVAAPISVTGYDGNSTNQGNGWQTTTKKKNKKGPKVLEPNQLIVNGGEHPPADESMRKGG